MAEFKVYLAGPEVFFADGRELIARKQELAQSYGFVPCMGNMNLPDDKFAAGLAISAHNEALMRHADFVIANITPFRGISADAGTVFEIGFMCGMEKPAFAYSNDPRNYDERAQDDYYKGAVAPAEDGILRARDGQMVEDHAMADNLMIDGGIIARQCKVIRADTGPRLPHDDLSVFEACLAEARKHFAGCD